MRRHCDRNILTALLLSLGFASLAHAEDRVEDVSISVERTRTTLLTIHPQVFPVAGGGIEVEHLVARHWTAFAAAGLGAAIGGSEATQTHPVGWVVEAGVRGFLFAEGPGGFWAGTKIGVATFTPDLIQAPTAGVMLGYTLISRAGFVFSAGGGLRMIWTQALGQLTPLPDVRLSIGWAL